MDRDEAIARRIAAQQLDRESADREVTDAAVLDFGVQNTGRDGASWALANRGVPLAGPAALETDDDLTLLWTLRSAPHYYRRDDLAGVLDATSPYSDADARKRTVDAGKQLAAAGIEVREALSVVAAAMREVATRPTAKGELSGALAQRLPSPYLRDCRSCDATHPYEIPFRLGALYGGLELTPGTSPPVLRRIPRWRRPVGPGDPGLAPARLNVIENYLRFLGPATPRDVAGFLDAPVTVVKQHWPEAAVEVEVAGTTGWALPDATLSSVSGLIRLLGPYDLFLQGRDRDLIVPDKQRHRSLWPVIGRPGAVLIGTDIVGTWRPRATGKKLRVAVDLWTPVSAARRRRIEEEAARLASHRGVELSRVDLETVEMGGAGT